MFFVEIEQLITMDESRYETGPRVSESVELHRDVQQI